ncbi:MAG: hypothetical protein OZ921_04660, partial [Sorangiineae bacterium]|nr:hypothetical protein [Sorangiineae bacterium]
ARGGGALSRYGPGYAEVFSLMARAGNTPEGGVFLEQALLASLAPIGAFAILRAAGARAVVAWPITVALAAEPLLARLGVSESYFATGFSLSMLAGATLAMGAARATLRARRFWLSALGAGLLVAQVARVHPLTWLAAACLPLIVVVGPGRLRTRLTLALGSALALGAVTAALSGSALGSVLTGSLGTEWLPAAAGRLRRSWALAPLALALLASLNFLRGRTRRFVVVAATAALVGAALRAGDVLGSPNPAVAGAYVRLFLPAMLAAVAALSRFIRGRHVRHGLALGVAVAAVFWSVSRWRPLTELPTDALEQGFAMGWRETLPRNATVVYLSRANRRSLVLPLYARGMPLSSSNRPPALSALPGAVFYYRSSLCDSAEGRSFCAALEASVRLGPRVERALPARASMRWDSYLETPVRVALFRVIREP